MAGLLAWSAGPVRIQGEVPLLSPGEDVHPSRLLAARRRTDATFRDEVFELSGAERIGGMWQMLIERGSDLTVEVSHIEADATRGSAHWEARYTFSATGRPVHNVIDATFELRDGLIVRTWTSSTSGAGRGRRWARPARCSAGCPWSAARSRRPPGAASTTTCPPGDPTLVTFVSRR